MTFGQDFIYLGIYTQKGFKDELAYSFGNNCEKYLAQAFSGQSHSKRNQDRNALYDFKKAAPTYDKLAQFREQTYEKIRRLMYADAERELFFNEIKQIK